MALHPHQAKRESSTESPPRSPVRSVPQLERLHEHGHDAVPALGRHLQGRPLIWPPRLLRPLLVRRLSDASNEFSSNEFSFSWRFLLLLSSNNASRLEWPAAPPVNLGTLGGSLGVNLGEDTAAAVAAAGVQTPKLVRPFVW